MDAQSAEYIIMFFCDMGVEVAECVDSGWVTELLWGVQDCIVERVELEYVVRILGDPIIQLRSGDAEE